MEKTKFIIDAVDGSETIAMAGERGTFCFVGKHLKSWKFNQFGPATDETEVEVLPVSQDGSFTVKFSAIISNPGIASITQAQAANFFRKYGWKIKRGNVVMAIIRNKGKFYVLVAGRAEYNDFYDGTAVECFPLSYFSGIMENHSIIIPKEE